MAPTEQKLATILKRPGYCGLCAAVLRDGVGHISRRPPPKKCKARPGARPLTDEERAEIVETYREELRDPLAAKRKKVEVAKAMHKETWRPSR